MMMTTVTTTTNTTTTMTVNKENNKDTDGEDNKDLVGIYSTYKLNYVGKCYTILLCVGAPILGLGVLILDVVYIFMFFLFL